MAYATVSDVESEFKDLDFSLANSKVSSAEVTTFIGQADAEITARISKKYTTPIVEADSPESFKILKMISVWIVADRVSDILEIKRVTSDEAKLAVRPESSARKARKLLDDIVKGDLPLVDATLASSHDGFKSFNVDNSIEHFFDATKQQW